MNHTLADRLQIWGLYREFALFSDSSLGFALEATPIDISCWDTGGLNAFAQRVTQFLNGLPVGLDIQFVQDICAGNETTLKQHETIAANSNNRAAQFLTDGRIERFRQLDRDGLLPSHKLYIFVRKRPREALVSKPKLFSKPDQFQKLSEDRLDLLANETERVQEELERNLKSLEIHARRLQPEKLLNMLYRQWNPGRSLDLGAYDPDEVRNALVYSDVLIDRQGFFLGSMPHRVISLKILPDTTYAGLAQALRNLPFDSRLFLSIHVPDQLKEIESLQTQRRMAYSMAFGKKTGVSDLESTAKFNDLETLLEQMISQGEKVFNVSLNILLRSTDEESLRDSVNQALNTLRELSGAEGMEESVAAFDVFSEFALPNARGRERTKRVKASNLCDLLPLYGPWSGHRRPAILMRTRMGSLFHLDPFDQSLQNANQLISGGSGAGKSFLTNFICLQMLNENPKIFFVDIGGSYKKLCENLDGQYIPLGLGDNISINPFDLSENESVPSSRKIKFLLGLCELVLKEEHETRLPKLERAELEDLIRQVYSKHRTPTLSDLRDLLLKHTQPSMQRYGRILGSWCGDTPFGQFIDRQTNVKLDKSVVAFDLKGLEHFAELQAVCLYLITDLVWREIQRDRGTKKILVFDECWKLLNDEAGVIFIEEVFRTFRKYNASATAISQSISDFAQSKIAGALIPNCSIKWILMQNQGDTSELSRVLNLNSTETALIQSLYQEKGVYSEAFLVSGAKDRAVAIVEPTPLELWISTTDPRDLDAIEKERVKHPGKTQLEILVDLARQYPSGVAAVESVA